MCRNRFEFPLGEDRTIVVNVYPNSTHIDFLDLYDRKFSPTRDEMMLALGLVRCSIRYVESGRRPSSIGVFEDYIDSHKGESFYRIGSN